LNLSVIIPVYNDGARLRCCLAALAASLRAPDEIILVDDGSTDDSALVARSFGVRVISLPDGPQGPARARNRGAAAAQGEILVFFDADVVPHADTLVRMERFLSKHPEIDALFGSYDDDSPGPGIVPRYKNLLHHYIHQHGSPQASTFWTGCGAIRHKAFKAMNGFDEGQVSLEDVELGMRLRRAGYLIQLCPEVQVTHLKQWTLASLLLSDIFDRAVPWTRLILSQGHVPTCLNLSVRSRLSALSAWAALAFLCLGFWSAYAWIGFLAAAATLGGLNINLYRFFARKGGVGFTLAAIGLHSLYLLYSSLTFLVVAALTRIRVMPNPG
jgi:glycosyltransferase involved in cell wall biosynthesis